ncbi:MAG TPA: type IV secretion system protein [Bacillota bacterium]|jgi:type IV secretion system protein TrbL|nr:type IV secretion system protein [Bacillota bacterium]HOL09908.1 type IV secretion system protein [Bacillota bacterium]HPO98136.1 type IV secretion system protein [Bacillota bacterium]
MKVDSIIKVTDQLLGDFYSHLNVLYSPAFTIFLSIITIDLVLAYILNLGSVDNFKLLVKKILKYGIICYVIVDYSNIIKTILNGFIWVGFKAGGGMVANNLGEETSISKMFPGIGKFLDQASGVMNSIGDNSSESSSGGIFGFLGKIVDQVKKTVDGIVEVIDMATDPTVFLKILVRAIVTGILSLITGFSLFMITLHYCVTYLEFYMVAILSLIFIPFGAYQYTSFLAEKAASAVISFGIKLMVLSFMLGIASEILTELITAKHLDFSATIYMCFASVYLALLTWHAPKVITGFLTGQSMYSGNDVLKGKG